MAEAKNQQQKNFIMKIFYLQSQYRFVCECICAAYMKISRNSALLAEEHEGDNDGAGDDD